MAKQTREVERSPLARLTGAVYLVYFATTIITTIVQSHIPKAAGEAGNLLAYALYAITTLLLYNLFKPVDKRLSMVAALVSLAGCLVGSVDVFHLPTYHLKALYFFAPYCLLVGILILGSKFLTQILGAWMPLAGVGRPQFF